MRSLHCPGMDRFPSSTRILLEDLPLLPHLIRKLNDFLSLMPPPGIPTSPHLSSASTYILGVLSKPKSSKTAPLQLPMSHVYKTQTDTPQ